MLWINLKCKEDLEDLESQVKMIQFDLEFSFSKNYNDSNQFFQLIARTTLTNMIDTIDGSIIMTPQIVDSNNAVNKLRVPHLL